MSKVFSFRLNKENPREARAIAILEAKMNDGISIRQVIIDGLLALSSNPSEVLLIENEKLISVMQNFLVLLNNGAEITHLDEVEKRKNREGDPISDQFRASVRKEVKKGLII